MSREFVHARFCGDDRAEKSQIWESVVCIVFTDMGKCDQRGEVREAKANFCLKKLLFKNHISLCIELIGNENT